MCTRHVRPSLHAWTATRRHAVLRLLWCAAAAAGALPVHAQVFAADDGAGGVLLTNHRPDGEVTLLVAAPQPPAPALAPATAAVMPAAPPAQQLGAADESTAATTGQALAPLIRAAAQRHALPESLLTAMVAVESAFDGRAVSPKGAKGLMQLMPDTARRFGVKDAFVPEQNLQGGAAYMRLLLDQFANDTPLALAAYNAGEGAVMRAGRRIPAYRETQSYVRKVLAHVAANEPKVATRR
jgi:soluble lytic murein transglycosylase-like protein